MARQCRLAVAKSEAITPEATFTQRAARNIIANGRHVSAAISKDDQQAGRRRGARDDARP